MDKKKQGDLFVLSFDIQEKRNKMFGIKPGEEPMYDLSALGGKIVKFDKYDTPHHKDWACRVSGQSFSHKGREVGIFEFLIPESSLISIEDNLKELIKKNKPRGVYAHITNDPNTDLFMFAFEVAQQANSNEASRSGIEKCVGKETTEFCVQLYPNIKLEDKYNMDMVFGLWKNRNVSLDSIREKNWNRRITLTDHIAFGFNYNGGKHDTIIVSNITSISEYGILCHFMYGHHSMSEYIKEEDVLAVGDPNGTIGIKGWSGKFKRLKTDSKLLDDNLK